MYYIAAAGVSPVHFYELLGLDGRTHIKLVETHKRLISEVYVLWWQRWGVHAGLHTTAAYTTWIHIFSFYKIYLTFFFLSPFCLSSTKNSGPQAWHLLSSRQTTTNIIFMLPLNPSWGSQSVVDGSMKQSKELCLLFFFVNLVLPLSLYPWMFA